MSFVHAQVQRVEYFFDTDPGYGNGIDAGTATALPSSLDRFYETVTFNASLETLSDGFHTLFVRAENSKGWSQTQFRPFVKTTLPKELSNEVAYIEYFIDADPGYHNAKPIDLAANTGTYTINAPLDLLSDGFHTFCVRAQNKYGKWSQVMYRSFVKATLPKEISHEIAYVEYFFDTDPGYGKGVVADSVINTGMYYMDAPVETLMEGFHTLYVRAQNKYGKWSQVMHRSFVKTELAPSEYVYIEYFIDTDPGRAKGASVPFTKGSMEIDFTAVLTGIEAGNHLLSIRGENKNHEWMDMGTHAFTVLNDTTGIDQIEDLSVLVVYPNPVSDLLFIKNESLRIDYVELIDINGNLLKTVMGKNNSILQLSLADKPTGVYLVRIYTNKQTKTVKVIKQ